MRTNLFSCDLYAHDASSRPYTNRKVLIEIGPVLVRFRFPDRVFRPCARTYLLIFCDYAARATTIKIAPCSKMDFSCCACSPISINIYLLSTDLLFGVRFPYLLIQLTYLIPEHLSESLWCCRSVCACVLVVRFTEMRLPSPLDYVGVSTLSAPLIRYVFKCN